MRSYFPHPSRRVGAILLLLLASIGCRRERPNHEPMLIVETVEPNGAAYRGGLRAGDELKAWEIRADVGSDPRRGRFQGLFDIGEVEVEEAPRGRVILHGRRGTRDITWELPPGDWELTLRPQLSASRLERYAARRGKHPEIAEALATELHAEGLWQEACWLLTQIGEGRAQAAKLTARQAFEKARAIAHSAGSLVVESRVWEAEGDAASSALDREEPYRRALQLREKDAQDRPTLALAMAQHRLGAAAHPREPAGAEKLLNSALAIRERLAPGSHPALSSLLAVGGIKLARGDLDEAAPSLQRALAGFERLAPGSRNHARALGNLGILMRQRGDLTGAEELYRHGLAIHEQVDPTGNDVAKALIHLGVLAKNRGEWEAAENYLRRALTIPRSDLIACYNNLGEVYQARGQLLEAEQSYRRSLELAEQLNPDSLDVAANLNNLGDLATASGHLDQAWVFLADALVVHLRDGPGSPALARNLSSLGNLALEEKQLSRAWRFHEHALTIRRRVAPESAMEAESLYAMGQILRDQGRLRAARTRWMEAVRALEAQRSRLAVSEQGKTAFGARYSGIFVTEHPNPATEERLKPGHFR